jgi:hypothetical protein
MSYRAIAAALALEDVSVGERLTAFSLASYANREHVAWPAARNAAARAGLGRRQYLAARGQLAGRGLIVLEQPVGRPAGGALVRLVFAERGLSIGREVNPELFESVLAHSPARGGARALLAALAALANRDGVVEGLSTEEICEAGGLSDRTYRRARGELLASNALALAQAGGGRARRNLWCVIDPCVVRSSSSLSARSRVLPGPRQMPLLAAVRTSAEDRGSGHHIGTGDGSRHPADGGVCLAGNPGINPGVNPGQSRTPSLPETPAQTPAETPAPYARAGRESQIQRTTPPDPPEGGQPNAVIVTEHFTSDRGRRRTRRVRADPAELAAITATDREMWETIRGRLREQLGVSAFEIWFAAQELIAVSSQDRALLLAGPADTRRWVASRYRLLFEALSDECGRCVRPATDRELAVHRAVVQSAASTQDRGDAASLNDHDQQEAM